MGGIRIIPDFSLDEIIPDTTDLIILTGGETWMENLHDPLMDKVKTWLNEGILIAAICGATIALANSGILDNRSHTSNNLEYLKTMCPNYLGEKFYLQEQVVVDHNLITASGIAPIEFAREVIKKLEVFNIKSLEAWYNLYITHEAQYFYKLMDSLEMNE